jgi:hypothetical protein
MDTEDILEILLISIISKYKVHGVVIFWPTLMMAILWYDGLILIQSMMIWN